MKRRFFSLATAVVLAIGLLGGSVAPVAAASYGDCVNVIGNSNYHIGRFLPYDASWVRDGISAVIDPTSLTFHRCTSQRATASAGPSAWVAFTGSSGNANSIFQVGIIDCNAPGGAYGCNGSGLQYFYAAGDASTLPHPHLLGAADYSPHQFEVYDDHLGHFVGYLGGWGTVTVNKSDLGWSSAWGLQWIGERLDSSDGLGSSTSGFELDFSGMQTHHAGLWANTKFGNSCNLNDSPGDSHCSQPSGNEMLIWTNY